MCLCYSSYCILLFVLVCSFFCLVEEKRNLKPEDFTETFCPDLHLRELHCCHLWNGNTYDGIHLVPWIPCCRVAKIKCMECALWVPICFADTRQLLSLWLFPVTQLHFHTDTHSATPMKSSFGSIASYFARQMIQNLYALPSFHYYSDGIYLTPCFQHAFASSECASLKLSLKASSWSHIKASVVDQAFPGRQVYCGGESPERGLWSLGSLSQRSFCFWSNLGAPKKNTPCSSQPPAPVISSALPKQVTIIFATGKATTFQGDHSTEMFSH